MEFFVVSSLAKHQIPMQHARIDRGWLPSVIYSLSFSPFYDITVNPSCVSALHTRGFAPGGCSRLILHGQYTRGFILRELAPSYGTHEGANERNLVWDSWYSPDEGLGTSSKLIMATSLWSRSKQKKLFLLMMIMMMMMMMMMMMVMMMMMMFEDDSSVSNWKSCQENMGSLMASEKTGERGFLYQFSRTVRERFRRILWIHENSIRKIRAHQLLHFQSTPCWFLSTSQGFQRNCGWKYWLIWLVNVLHLPY